MISELDIWRNFIDSQVVIDTNSSYIYLGKLKEVSEWFITLQDVDVHDTKEGSSTKECYIIDAKKYGIKANRKSVIIRKELIVSFSLLEDVIEY